MLDIPCVIFAGGKSSRMREDKALLPFAGFNTLTEFQLTRLKKIFKTVYISCKDKTKFDFEANFIEDIPTDNIFAPTAGFVSVFNKIDDESFFALSVDTPFISDLEIEKILKKDSIQADATIARLISKAQPMCGIYHRSLEESFSLMLKMNNHKLGSLLKKSKTIFVDFENYDTFLNLNTPDDYKKALLILSI